MNNHEFKGYITKEAIFLENQLLSQLQQQPSGNASPEDRIKHIGNTFDEVIKKDKNFGRLLLKIKSAYDQYLETLKGNISSMITEREAKEVHMEENAQMKGKLAKLQTENDELKKQIAAIKAEQVKVKTEQVKVKVDQGVQVNLRTQK